MVKTGLPNNIAARRATREVDAGGFGVFGGSGFGSGVFSLIRAPPCPRNGEPCPCQYVRYVVVDRGRHQDLLTRGDQLREAFTATGVQLGEHVVEDQHRLIALARSRSYGAGAAPARTTRTRRVSRIPSRASHQV